MDLSALIFVALAAAWAVYLIPKALRHHEEVAGSRSVEGFSDRLRVLARREPSGRGNARLVVTPGRPAPGKEAVVGDRVVVARPLSAAQVRARRTAAVRAARRRLRVVLTILLAGVVVGVLAATGVVGWAYVAIPGGVLVAWLVACRLMVRRERAEVAPARASDPVRPASRMPILVGDEEADEDPLTEEIAAITVEQEMADAASAAAAPVPAPAPGGWDLVPVTLPTYVGKDSAPRRTVRTIDLDSTGVWTSGRSAADSALAREAEKAARAEAEESTSDAERRRASGS